MNKPFRFIHSADLHLDSPLKSLARRDQSLADAVENATREAFTRIIDLCIEHRVDALLLAGDIYDSNNPSVATVGFFIRQLNRLKDAKICVYLIRGNHDHYAKLTSILTLPDHVVEFTGKKKFDVLDDYGIVVHGVSFNPEHATESALRSFKAPAAEVKNIAMLHTSLGGSEGHDAYAPCTPSDLDSMGFDYWALGHIHKRKVIKTDTTTIVMPGTPQSRDMGESGKKSVSLVTLSNDICTVDEIVVSPIRFEKVVIDLSSNNTKTNKNGQFSEDSNELDNFRPGVSLGNHETTNSVNKSEKHLTENNPISLLVNKFLSVVHTITTQNPVIDRWIVRIECHTNEKNRFQLQRNIEDTENSIRLACETLGNVHLDKIVFFKPLQDNEKHNQVSSSFVNDLKSTIAHNTSDSTLTKLSDDEFDKMIKLLPSADMRNHLQDTAENRKLNIEQLQKQGVDELLSLIHIDRKSDS